MINIGKKVNSMSGFLDGIINFVFRFLSEDTTVMDAIVTAGVRQDIGKKFGQWARLFFSSEVSSYQRDYTVTNNSN